MARMQGAGDKYFIIHSQPQFAKLSDLSVALTIYSPSLPIPDRAARSCQSVICPLTLQIWHAMSAPHILAAHTRPTRRIVVNCEHSPRYPFVINCESTPVAAASSRALYFPLLAGAALQVQTRDFRKATTLAKQRGDQHWRWQ